MDISESHVGHSPVAFPDDVSEAAVSDVPDSLPSAVDDDDDDGVIEQVLDLVSVFSLPASVESDELPSPFHQDLVQELDSLISVPSSVDESPQHPQKQDVVQEQVSVISVPSSVNDSPQHPLKQRWDPKLKLNQDRVEEHCDVMLALGAEMLARIGHVSHDLKDKYFNRLSFSMRDALQSRKRCMFSWMCDLTSLVVVAQLLQLEGPALLLALVCSVVVLNSAERFQKMMPTLMELFGKVNASANEQCHECPEKAMFKEVFEKKFEELFGRKAPPQAILQSVRSTLGRHGCHNHFENSGSFIQDAAQHVQHAWGELMELRNQSSKGKVDRSEGCKAILRKHFGLGPFSAMICSRYLSLFCGECMYPTERKDLFQYSRMGLGLMADMEVQDARVLLLAAKDATNQINDTCMHFLRFCNASFMGCSCDQNICLQARETHAQCEPGAMVLQELNM